MFILFLSTLIKPNTISYLAVDTIQRHMNRQSQSNQPGLGNKAEQNIEPNQPQLMERMKANAAAIGVVDRVGQQMVNIHQHGRHKSQIGELPMCAQPLIAR